RARGAPPRPWRPPPGRGGGPAPRPRRPAPPARPPPVGGLGLLGLPLQLLQPRHAGGEDFLVTWTGIALRARRDRLRRGRRRRSCLATAPEGTEGRQGAGGDQGEAAQQALPILPDRAPARQGARRLPRVAARLTECRSTRRASGAFPPRPSTGASRTTPSLRTSPSSSTPSPAWRWSSPESWELHGGAWTAGCASPSACWCWWDW